MASDEIIGPALPPILKRSLAGPALPPDYKRGEPSSSSEDSEPEVARATRDDPEDDGFFGPALPPGFKKQQSSPERPPVLGPALPPGFQRAAYDSDDPEDGEGLPGPALPPGYQAELTSSEGEDEDVIGPMPAKGPVQDSVALDFERRAQRMREKLTGEVDAPEVVTRETWMTELPPELQHIGLGARTFKKKSGPENKDRSIWTDTPADRERKARERLEGKKTEKKDDKVPQVSPRDIDMAEKVSKYNESKRAESLMSLHSKKLKEKAKETADIPVERRPFDRDADLQVNRFDEAQKQRLLKKSQELNTRFSHSKDRMFL
uniref:GPALPP motifs-containing protein 1 n=1 Tax=Fundulus heteroclitus TaxID=8078 RepID=A0A3Q2NXQ4_FUNHE